MPETVCGSTHGAAGYMLGSYRIAGTDLVVCGGCGRVVPYYEHSGKRLPVVESDQSPSDGKTPAGTA